MSDESAPFDHLHHKLRRMCPQSHADSIEYNQSHPKRSANRSANEPVVRIHTSTAYKCLVSVFGVNVSVNVVFIYP